MKVGRKSANRADGNGALATAPQRGRRGATAAEGSSARSGRQRAATRGRRAGEPRGPQTAPGGRPADRPAPAKTASQAKARSKARKAKAPKAIRLPLRERLIARLARIELSPRALLARIPFVVLVMGFLALGLVITLWLSTDAARRSYQLSSARSLNDALMQQKESLERDVLEAQSAPALADAARDLGMIPSSDTAHLVQDPAGNWIVVGQPKPAEGAPPPPLNTKLPDLKPAPPPAPAAPPPAQPVPLPNPGARAEVPTRIPPGLLGGLLGATGSEVPLQLPSTAHTPAGTELPGPAGQGGLVFLPVAPAAPADSLPQVESAPVLAPQTPPFVPVPPVAPVAPEAGQ